MRKIFSDLENVFNVKDENLHDSSSTKIDVILKKGSFR